MKGLGHMETIKAERAMPKEEERQALRTFHLDLLQPLCEL